MKKYICILLIIVLIYGLIPLYSVKEGKVVDIPAKTSYLGIVSILEKEEIIGNTFQFFLYSIIQNSFRKLKAGEYYFEKGSTEWKVLGMLVEGKMLLHQVTIPEGYNLKDIAKELAKAKLVDEKEFLKITKDKEFVKLFNIPSTSLEGYLFPDTYYFTKGVSAFDIITKMHSRFNEKVPDEMKIKAEKMGLTLNEIVILASIVEKETGKKEEKPLVASVFFNRLRIKMPLQSDPTTIYGIENFNGDLKREDLRKKTPYNTYSFKGLPPTPIANPGLDSINAVLNPARTNYLYFVSRNDGSHVFSRDYKHHNVAVTEFQKKN